jgi:hypothetical protein
VRSHHTTPSPRSAGRRASSGLSIVGVLACLCAIGILAMFAIPAFFSRASVTLHNAARLLARDLRSAQNAAAYARTEALVQLDADGWRAVDASGAAMLTLGEGHPIERRFSRDAVFEGVSIESVDCGPDRAIGIDRHGVIVEPAALTLRIGGEVLALRLDRHSGQLVAADSE